MWWARQDSNLEPGDYESLALTVELQARTAIVASETRRPAMRRALREDRRRCRDQSMSRKLRSCSERLG